MQVADIGLLIPRAPDILAYVLKNTLIFIKIIVMKI